MKLSSTSEYAIRILSFMANDKKDLYSAGYLVEKLKISDKYLRKLMTKLKKAGFVESKQGREGGYSFQKNISHIFISDIIEAVEGMEKYMGCILGFCSCSDKNPCSMHNTWKGTREQLINKLRTTSLSNLNVSPDKI